MQSWRQHRSNEISLSYTSHDRKSELDMGPFCQIQSNPIHKLTDLIQSDPRCVSLFRPTSNPIHPTPSGGENNFTCIQKSVPHFELMHAAIDVNNKKQFVVS